MMASTVRSIVCLHMGACSVRLHGSPDRQAWLSILPETTSWQRDCEIMRILHPGARSFLVIFFLRASDAEQGQEARWGPARQQLPSPGAYAMPPYKGSPASNWRRASTLPAWP